MQLNTQNIVERAVFEGLVQGLRQVLGQPAESAQPNPEQIVDTLFSTVMTELGLIITFPPQPVETTEAFNQLVAH